MTDAVTYQQDGGVVTLTLNEPDTRNALSPAIIDAIETFIDSAYNTWTIKPIA